MSPTVGPPGLAALKQYPPEWNGSALSLWRHDPQRASHHVMPRAEVVRRCTWTSTRVALAALAPASSHLRIGRVHHQQRLQRLHSARFHAASRHTLVLQTGSRTRHAHHGKRDFAEPGAAPLHATQCKSSRLGALGTHA